MGREYWFLRRVVLAASVALGSNIVAGCQACDEFDCTGGFSWAADVSDGLQSIEIVIETPASIFVHHCAFTEDAAADPCVVDVERKDPSVQERSSIELSDEAIGPNARFIHVHTFEPTDDEGSVTEARGPETIAVRVTGDGEVLLEETYEPQYVVQSRGRGCGPACQHVAEVRVDLRP